MLLACYYSSCLSIERYHNYYYYYQQQSSYLLLLFYSHKVVINTAAAGVFNLLARTGGRVTQQHTGVSTLRILPTCLPHTCGSHESLAQIPGVIGTRTKLTSEAPEAMLAKT